MSRTTTTSRTVISSRPDIQTQTNSLFFNGVNTKATIASATGVSTLTAGMSVGGWFKSAFIRNATAGVNFPQPYTVGAGPFSYDNIPSGNISLKCHLTIGGVLKDGNVSSVVTPNTWYHHVLDYDGATLNAFTNGVLQGSTAATGTISFTNDSIFLGVANGGGGNAYWGYMCQFFVSAHLTAAQIAAIANQGQYPAGLTALYMMNEGTGTTLNDTSGNGSNMAITNGNWTTDTPWASRSLTTSRTTT